MARTPNPVQKVTGFAQQAKEITVGLETFKTQQTFPGAKVEVFQYRDDNVEVIASRYDKNGNRQTNNFVFADENGYYELFLETGYYNLKYSEGGIDRPFKQPLKIESRTYNVRDYGAKGDGVTDDTLAIQTALETMIAANPNAEGTGTLLFPSGRYIVSRPTEQSPFLFDLPSGIVIQ